MIKTFWDKLNSRQQKFIGAAAASVVLILILETIVFPFADAKKRLVKAISVHEKKLAEMYRLSEEFAKWDRKITSLKRTAGAPGTDFTLFSLLEKRAYLANVRGRITSMKASKGAQTSSFEENLVDMKLDKITIKQLCDFLFYVESSDNGIRIKKITISKMKENPDYLSAQLQVSSLHPL